MLSPTSRHCRNKRAKRHRSSSSSRLRVVATEAVEQLRPYGKGLRDAVQFYLAHLETQQTQQGAMMMAEALAQYGEARQQDADRGDLAEASRREIAFVIKRVSSALGHLRLAEVKTDTLESFLNGLQLSARSRINIRAKLSHFFNFCRRRGWLDRNPCELISYPRAETGGAYFGNRGSREPPAESAAITQSPVHGAIRGGLPVRWIASG